MIIYSNITEKDLENLCKLAEQEKEQRALKIKNRIIKQTHDVKLAESLSPITKKLDEVSKPITQKLDDINENTQKVSEESNFENNKEIVTIESNLLKDTFKYLSESSNSLKLNTDKNDNLSILDTPLKSLGGDRVQVYDNIYEFTPQIHKALSNPSYTGKSMRDENDRRNLYNFLTDIRYTGLGDEKTNQKKFFTKLIKDYRNIKREEPDNLEGKGIQKNIIPSNIIDIYTRLEILLGLKISGHTDTLTEASNLIDELFKLGEIQNKQQYRNALNKFQT